MTEDINVQLFTSYVGSGWTAIKKESGGVVSYVRGISPQKVVPPKTASMITFFENGAQCIVVAPFEVEDLEYFETHEIEIQPGSKQKHPSRIIGCRSRFSGVEVKSWEVSADQKELLIIFEKGGGKFDIMLTQDGSASVVQV